MKTFNELLRPVAEPFFGKSGELEDADCILFGAPLDKTASYRGGSRFAPSAIREASQYMESYSVRTGFDWEDLKLVDIGDVIEVSEVELAVGNIQRVAGEIKAMGKFPVMLGGEHTVTLGALRALKPSAVVVFDVCDSTLQVFQDSRHSRFEAEAAVHEIHLFQKRRDLIVE